MTVTPRIAGYRDETQRPGYGSITMQVIANSCDWEPELQRHWYQVGFNDGLTIGWDTYTTDEMWHYGIRLYHRLGRLTVGSYDQGIHDALVLTYTGHRLTPPARCRGWNTENAA